MLFGGFSVEFVTFENKVECDDGNCEVDYDSSIGSEDELIWRLVYFF